MKAARFALHAACMAVAGYLAGHVIGAALVYPW